MDGGAMRRPSTSGTPMPPVLGPAGARGETAALEAQAADHASERKAVEEKHAAQQTGMRTALAHERERHGETRGLLHSKLGELERARAEKYDAMRAQQAEWQSANANALAKAQRADALEHQLSTLAQQLREQLEVASRLEQVEVAAQLAADLRQVNEKLAVANKANATLRQRVAASGLTRAEEEARSLAARVKDLEAQLVQHEQRLEDVEEEREVEDALQGILGGVRGPAWPAPQVTLRGPQAAGSSKATASGGRRLAELGLAAAAQDQPPQPAALASLVPVPPLEIDFIAGPRMGEKIVLTDRVISMGRSDESRLVIGDTTLANISRVHCVFEYVGSRWHLRDNSSTNGTWQRLSCVLQPSVPMPLSPGMSVLAGMHEFLVEEAELTHWWLPCAASGVLDEIGQRHRSASP